MISQTDAEQWVAVGVSSVAISVDGPEAIHDSIRGAGTYSSTMSAVETLSRAKKKAGRQFPLINLRSTITARNAGSLTDMVRVAEKAGADYCTFQVLNHTTRLGGIDLQDDLECSLQLPAITAFPTRTLADQLSRIRDQTPSAIRVRILPDLSASALLDHYENRLQTRNYRCVSPWTVMYVSPYGEVYPCLNYRVGSLRERPLRQLWNGHRYRQFRLRLMRGGLFADCRGCCDLLRRGSSIGSGKSVAAPLVSS
jgi:MoaA/NifB/PqqE/SkfB family radical SAM enzyme